MNVYKLYEDWHFLYLKSGDFIGIKMFILVVLKNFVKGITHIFTNDEYYNQENLDILPLSHGLA